MGAVYDPHWDRIRFTSELYTVCTIHIARVTRVRFTGLVHDSQVNRRRCTQDSYTIHFGVVYDCHRNRIRFTEESYTIHTGT
eukprot:7277163-Pyramimonas_sp.AAC.1